MTKYIAADLDKEIAADIKAWNKELYKKDNKGHRIETEDLGKATWRIVYNDGGHVDGPKGYADLKRTNVKSISVVSNGKVLHTVQVVNNFFAIRIRNFVKGLVGEAAEYGWIHPKRVFILCTKGNIAFVWDDGDIDELTEFGKHNPYRPIKLRADEK